MKKIFITALVAAIILGLFTLSAQAEDKAARGGKNLVLGWTEIPSTIAKVTKDTKNPLIGLTVGTVKGIMNAFARTASGAVDIVTLPAKSTDQEMKPQMIEVSTTTAPAKSKNIK